MKALRQIDSVLARVEGWLIIVLLWAMLGLTFIQVCLRALYTHGHLQWANTVMGHMDWSEPFVRLLVLWLTFLGASLLTQDNKHIKIDLFSSLLPERWLPFREFFLSLASALVCAIMVKVCAGYVALEMDFGARMFLQIPSWVGQLILPGGFSLLLLRFLLRAVHQGVEVFTGTK